MLQQETLGDVVISTGQKFIVCSASQLDLALRFKGEAENEKAIVAAFDGEKHQQSRLMM